MSSRSDSAYYEPVVLASGQPNPSANLGEKENDPVHRPTFFVVLTALTVAVAACSGAATSPSSPGAGAASGPAASAVAAEFDQQFIDMMVPHHQAAVEMAKVAQERAERPELKQLAAEIVEAQEGEIERLREWRKAWFGSDETPGMAAMPMLPGMGGMEGHSMGDMTMDMTKDVEALKSADDFDRAFIEAMIPHHETAIEAGKLAEEQGGRPEIKQLGGEIVAAQEREISQMRAWLEAWY